MKLLFNYLVFPGLLFSIIVGLLAGWVDRKVSARIQWRVGPPWYQNFLDIIKLIGKETILPEGAKRTFLWSPVLGLCGIVLAATIIGRALMHPLAGLMDNLMIILYLLVIPALALIIGASSLRNPLAAIGASREMKLAFSYELPFILSIIVVIIKSSGAVQISQIIKHQINSGSLIGSLSGAIAFVVSLICMQAKLGLVPFDASEAEQEIMAGALIEYSGLPLAIFKLTKAILLYTMPLFIISLFWAKDIRLISIVIKYILLLVVIILIKNTNPRLRIDQAMKFFLVPLTLLAIAAVILAALGL